MTGKTRPPDPPPSVPEDRTNEKERTAMTAPDPLAVSQARDTAALARELLGADARGPTRSCTWGDDAWHRAVSRLTRLDGNHDDFRRLLAEERDRGEEARR